MNTSALITLLIIGSIVWGGFMFTLWYAMQQEKKK